MTITASTAQVAGTGTIDSGPKVQSANFSLSSAGTTHTAEEISSTNLIAITATRFGTLASETLTLQISVDGGVNFRDFKTYSLAEINVANGMYRVEQVKGTHARFTLNNPQVGSGLNCRFFV